MLLFCCNYLLRLDKENVCAVLRGDDQKKFFQSNRHEILPYKVDKASHIIQKIFLNNS